MLDGGFIYVSMQFQNADVFFAAVEQRLNHLCRLFQSDWQDACDFGVKCSAVADGFEFEDFFGPGGDFVAGGSGGFVEVYGAVFDELLSCAL